MWLICLEDNCANVCCFVMYLLDIRQIDRNAKFRNEFCNCNWLIRGYGTICRLNLDSRAPVLNSLKDYCMKTFLLD